MLSVVFCSVLLCSVLLYSVLLSSVLFCSTPSHSICSALFCTILFLYSWALRDVRDVSSLYVTQISSTFFSLHHHSMPPHTEESEHNTAVHDVTVSGGDVIMGGNDVTVRYGDVENPFKLHTPLSILHGHKDKEKNQGCSDRPINTRMATIRIQQSNLTKDTDNYHHNARDKKITMHVDVEFENSHDYNVVHTKICETPTFFNASDTLKLQTEYYDKGDFQKMKMQFSIGPEIGNLRIFVTSLCAAYPKHLITN